MTSELAQPADPARHRPGVLAVPLPRCLDGRGFRGPAETRPHPHDHLCPRGLRLLNRVDLLWQRGACGESGPRVPDHLSRSRPRGAPVAPHSEQARAGLQGAAHHLHLRLHLEPLRQVGEPGHPRRPPRGRRHDSLHRPPAPRGVGHLQPDHAGRLGAGRVRPDPPVAVTLAFFGILFGARNLDFTKQQTGLMTAVAAESVVNLVAFPAGGIWVTWGVFGGLGEIFGSIARDPVWSTLLTLDQPQTASHSRWAAMLLISMMAVMFLPRQFHVLVVQNPRARDVNALAWSVPLYLLLINLFVLPIAFAGLLVFPESGGQADSFILRLPLHFESRIISVVVFLGGFSAATAMIVVDSLALSKMITNDVILPMLLRRRRLEDIYLVTLYYTRAAMLAVVGLGFAWARMERGQLLLVEMGLLSFIAVSQCAPAILLGLYWRRGNRKGAAAGISAGFALWFYTLIIPALVKEGLVPTSVLADGPFGLQWLNPTALLGLSGLDVTTHGVFWSLFVNIGLFVLVSLLSEQDADDRSQAAAFVGTAGEDKHATVAPAILP